MAFGCLRNYFVYFCQRFELLISRLCEQNTSGMLARHF